MGGFDFEDDYEPCPSTWFGMISYHRGFFETTARIKPQNRLIKWILTKYIQAKGFKPPKEKEVKA